MMQFSTTLCTAIAVFVGLTQANSDFAASCNDWYMTDGTSIMNGICANNAGNEVHSTLDLNLCIGNSFGYLYVR